MRRHILGLTTAVIVLQISLGCAMLPANMKPQVVGVTPRVTSIDLKGIDLAFDLDIKNPYPTALKTPEFTYDLNIAGMSFASREATATLNIPARSTGTTTLPVRIDFADLFSLSQNLKGANEAPYSIGGRFIVPVAGQRIEVPFSHEGTFPVLRIPKFSNIRVNPGGISLTGAKIDVQADMVNPNVFAIGLSGLGYSLELGGVKLGDITARTADSLAPGAKGTLSLSGKLSAKDAITSLAEGAKLGRVRIVLRGKIQTPYGEVNLGG